MTFWERLFVSLKTLLSSGKVITAVVGMIVAFAAKHNIVLSPDDVDFIIKIFAALLIGQGAADFGKNAAIVTAANPPPPTEQTQIVNVPPATQPVKK